MHAEYTIKMVVTQQTTDTYTEWLRFQTCFLAKWNVQFLCFAVILQMKLAIFINFAKNWIFL